MSAEPTRWRDIAITAYGPTVLVAIGQGAILRWWHCQPANSAQASALRHSSSL
jgi:hypothetical protein